MKKLFAILSCLFASAIVFAASQTPVYVDTEQKYVFSVDNLSQTIPEFVEDTAKQEAMANKYLELANKETGAVSIKDLFDICEAGGFKPRREEGYAKCREFVVKLLETVEQELEDGTLTGYCPGLDENGKNPNKLKSITDATRVGDFCSSTNIAAGEVVFKKGYNCTCAAYACNNCCESIGGACLTKVADSNGNCLRKEYDNVQNLNAEGAALKFCESKAQRGCKVINAIKNFNSVPGKVVCNATQAEYNAVVALNTPCPDTAYAFTNENNTLEKCRSFCIGKAKENSCKSVNVVHRPSTKECVCNPDKETVRRLNMKYYQVCGKDKGKSGGSIEECLRVFTDKVYGGTQVSLNIGIALAKEWARVKGYREIECDTKIYDYSALDDSILCSSIDKDKNGKRGYFEFVFDDLKESKDMTLNDSFYDAVFTRIYGYNRVSSLKAYMAWDTKSESNCNKVNDSLKKMCGRGCSVIWGHNGNKYCYLDLYTNLPTSERTAKTGPNDFDNPFNIDPFMFCKGAQTQLQNTSSLDVLLRQYISNASGYPMSKIECFAKTTSYCGGGCKCNDINLDPNDDIKECVVHGDKDYYVDFVFDDITEFSKKREKGALQSMGCVVSGGTFNGQECKFANKSQCDTYIKSMSKVCPQCTKPKWNPDTGLCEVPDAAAVTAMEKHEKTAMIVGGVVVSVVVTVATAGSGAPVIAIVLSGVEVAGGAMEYFAQQHIDGMAHDFFLKSAKCNNASCAAKMISENMQEMANIQNDLEDYEINALDAEFERLLGLIEPSSDFYMQIAEKGTSLQDNQKGFFDPDSWNEAQVWRAIGIGLQFVSLGTGAITKIIQGPKFANKFPKMQAMLLKQVKISKKIKDTKKVTSAVEMSAGQAKRLDELDGKIATLESKTNRSAAEADELKKLHQERNELKNKIGTKDADELDKAKNVAFDKKAVETANKEYDTAKQRYDYVRKYMAEHNGNPPKGTDKYAVQKINNDMAAAEKKLKDLGQDVEPVEPLQIGKKPTVEPAEAKPVESGTNPKETGGEPKPVETEKATEPKSTEPKPAESGTNPKETNGEPKLADDLLIDMSNNVNQSRLMAGKLNKTELAKLRKHYPDLDDLALQQKAKEIGQEISKQKIANGGFLDSEVRAMDDATRNADNVDNVATGAKTTQKGATNASKSQKIAEARQRGDLGYHGTDADISMDDMIRSSANSSDQLGGVGYGIARDYDAAEKYAVKRLVERQNVGKNITFYREGDVLVVKSNETLNLSNKTGYVYTTAKEPSVKWETLRNGYVGAFDAAQMPHSVEVLDKKAFNLDDLVRQGRVKIIEPEATKAANTSSGAVNSSRRAASDVDNVADAGKGVKPTKTAGKWADATVPDPTFDIKVTPLELGGKKYYLKSGDTESLIQNEISRTKQAHELLKYNKIVTSVDVVEDDQTVLKAFMDAHPDITLPRTPDTQYFIMEATHANNVEGLSDAEILGYLRNKPITIEEQNTILSELQNMNNNGLIHNDIWHNFAIYRDSSGKLHMELMDFGDFTSAQKLHRSNDDVLEIKKLFSSWSDKGLVEKTATPKVTANTASKTAGKAVSKADDVASGASRASTNVSSGKKMYSPGLLDGNVYKPKTTPDQDDTVWELTEVAPNKYQITVYKDAEKKILANPSFLEGADKQVFMRYDHVELIEPGIAEMDAATGKLRITKVPEVWLVENASTAAKTVNKVDDVADASKGARSASRTATKTQNITDLRRTASQNFDTYLAEAKTSANGKSAHKIPKSRLDDAGWTEVNKSLASENVQLVDTGDGYMQFVRKTTTVIETPAEEANKLFNIYGLSLGNMNGLEIPMSRFGNGEKTVNELARLVEKKGGYLQQIGDKIVVRKPGKTGWDLRRSLKEHGIVSNRYASDTFHEVHIRSGDQCVSGLKFHVSVNVEDLEIASYVVDDLVKRTDVADIWKVYSDGMTGTQKGKDFTIYVSQNGYDSDKIQRFLKELENELKDRNIRPNGYGNNIATGDKPVSGSDYMYYRYDRTNASGIPDGEYNSSYNFVAPNSQYGGDIMRNISIM